VNIIIDVIGDWIIDLAHFEVSGEGETNLN
jgi:hypothetical protein